MTSPPPKHSLSSPAAGNSHQPVLPTPSSSTSVSLRQINYRSNQLRKELELQLFEKQRQMQQSSSGIGKNVLARQIAQLQERIKEIDTVTQNIDLQSTSSLDRLRSLDRDLTSHRSHPLSPGISSIRNKEKLLNQRSTSSSSAGNGLSPLPSPSASTLLPPAHGHDSTSLLPLPPPPTGSTPTKRRSKIPATDRRNTDIEFATEIGQGLLLEVRKMQALLQEKEEKLRVLENQKADLERTAEAMAKQMRQREEIEENLKEETWNLELAKQELVISVTELQSNLNKANSDQHRLAKQTSDLRTEIEQLRDKEEKLKSTIENMKQRHEQDMTSIRRQAAAFQREKQEQAKKIEALTSELAIMKAQSRISKHSSIDSDSINRRSVFNDEQADTDQLQSNFAVKSDQPPVSSPPSSPKISPNRQAMEVETLKTSLAHAHRMVSNLRSNLHKEKTEKFEFKKLLAESQETIEQLRNDPRLWVDAGPARSSNGSPTTNKMEDSPSTGRRSRKVSHSSSKRRGKRSHDHRRYKTSKNKNTSENDSVYSYSSMSDNDSSLDESDGDPTAKAAGFQKLTKPDEFTVLLSELHPVVIDAQVNTDPMTGTPRSLSDELETAGSSSPVHSITGGLIAPAASVGVQSLLKQKGVEVITQTNCEPEIFTVPGIEVFIQTDVISGTNMSVQADFTPSTLESSTQTESQPKLQVFEMSIQTENSFTTTEISVQTDDVPVPQVSEISTQTDPKPGYIDTTVQTELASSDILVRNGELLVIEISTQTEPELKPVVADIFIQTDTTVSSEIFIQTDSVTPSETFVQTETSIPSKVFVQTELVLSSEMSVQTTSIDIAETPVQTEVAFSPGISVQTETANICEILVQTEPCVPSEIFVQTETVASSEVYVQTETVPVPVAAEAFTHTSNILQHVILGAAFGEPMMATLDSYSPYPIDIHPEDPSITMTALSTAPVTAVRAARIEAAADHENKYDTIPGKDRSVQSKISAADTFSQIDDIKTIATDDAIETKNCKLQVEPKVISDTVMSANTKDMQAQSDILKDIQIQSKPAKSANLRAQSIPKELRDMSVQSDPIIARDPCAQHIALEPKDVAVRSIPADTSFQSNTIDAKDMIVQSKPVEMKDKQVQKTYVNVVDNSVQCVEMREISIQSMPPQTYVPATKDMATQYEVTETKDANTQSESAAKIDCFTQSDTVVTKDSIVQSQSIETIDTLVQSELVETKDSIVQYEPIESRDIGIQYEIELDSSADGLIQLSDSNNILIHSIDDQEENKERNENASNLSVTSLGLCKNHDSSMIRSIFESDSFEKYDSFAKVYTKAETDALIATAVASALANTSLSVEVIENTAGDAKRHTCDLSSNKNNSRTESSTTTPYTRSLYMINDDDDYHYSEEDFGDVMVHLPTDRDIITYSPYRKEREDHQREFPVVAKPRELDLSMGPSIVYELKPTEDEVSPLTIVSELKEKHARAYPVIEIPKRPTSRPPTDLLTKAYTSSPLSETPSSDKFKTPYYDLDVPPVPSHRMIKSVSMNGSIVSSANDIESSQFANSAIQSGVASIDPAVVSLITQTMIGDWLWKYTRNTVGHGMSENRHQRYFWIHPYTRTLYWSTNAPGLDGSEAKAKAKRAFIESVTTVPDTSAGAVGLPNVSLLIKTSHRQLKLTAPTMEKHEAWLESLSYLVDNNDENMVSGIALLNDMNRKPETPTSLLNRQSLSSINSSAILKASSFRRANNMLRPSFVSTDFDDDEDIEPIEDVRMCCNGKHHVSKLEKDHMHRHHFRKRKSRATLTTVA